jgi:hypothetical protein
MRNALDKKRNTHNVFTAYPVGNGLFGRHGLKWKIILKFILNKQYRRMWIGFL